MIPIHILIFICIFRKRKNDDGSYIVDNLVMELVGYLFALPMWIIYLFFKNQFIDIIVMGLLRYKVP